MNNYLKKSMFVLILFLGIISCADDNENEVQLNVGNRSQICDQSFSFSKSIYSFASFTGDENSLTNTERLMTVPKGEYYEQTICKRSNGTIYYEIESKHELAENPVLEENAIAPRSPIKWKSTNDNGNVSIYDGENQLIDSYTTSPVSADEVSRFYKVELMAPSEYEIFVNALKDQMHVIELPNNMFKVITLNSGSKTETIFDRQFQNMVAIHNFDIQGNIQFKTSYYYKSENNLVILSNEINESYKKSLDSDKIMTLLTMTEYHIQ